MSIQIKFFASLRERMGMETTNLNGDGEMSVAEVWEAVAEGEALPENILVAVNLEYTQSDHVVRDGDEVAFFPPVTGG